MISFCYRLHSWSNSGCWIILQTIWTSWSLCKWYLGYHLWWLLEQHRCQCCVSATWILTSWLQWYCHHIIIPNIVHCVPSGAIALSGVYTEWNRPTLINDLNCTGSETSIFKCPFNSLVDYSCHRYADAAVICQGEYLYNVFNSSLVIF